MENSQNNSNSLTRQRHNTRHIIQAHSITLIDSKNTRKNHPTTHHKQLNHTSTMAYYNTRPDKLPYSSENRRHN